MRSPLLVAFVLLATSVGCGGSYYREHLASHLPRGDGSRLDVVCISHVRHDVSSVSPTLTPEPNVIVIQDDREFVVTASEVTFNGDRYASLAPSAERVEIEITETGFSIEVDGEPVGER